LEKFPVQIILEGPLRASPSRLSSVDLDLPRKTCRGWRHHNGPDLKTASLNAGGEKGISLGEKELLQDSFFFWSVLLSAKGGKRQSIKVQDLLSSGSHSLNMCTHKFVREM